MTSNIRNSEVGRLCSSFISRVYSKLCSWRWYIFSVNHFWLNFNGRITGVDAYNTGIVMVTVKYCICIGELCMCGAMHLNAIKLFSRHTLCLSLLSSFASFHSLYPVLITYLHHKCCSISEEPFAYGLKMLCPSC